MKDINDGPEPSIESESSDSSQSLLWDNAPMRTAINGRPQTSVAGKVRHSGGAKGSADRQSELGQFLTPDPVAAFMSSLFLARMPEVRLLDAGAGAGALSTALINRLCGQTSKPVSIHVDAYEY